MASTDRALRLLVLPVLLALAAAPLGAQADDDIDLRELDGTPVTLSWEESRATVLVFWATGCPCVRRYQGRIDALQETWGPRGVRVIAISSNVDDDVEKLRRLRDERAPGMRLLVDEGGRLAKALDAKSTPTVVVLDDRGKVRYHGWIDNERLPGERGRQAWLEEALEDLLAGREVRRPRTPTWGCRITRSFGDTPRCHAPPDDLD